MVIALLWLQAWFSFAVTADVQYADRPPAGRRDYRASAEKLERFAAAVNAGKPAFAIQLGDLIDGGEANLGRILAIYNRIEVPRRHVLGNHDGVLPTAELLKRLGMKSAWYTFAKRGWRFAVLDSMAVSGAGPRSTPAGVVLLEELKRARAKNAVEWNGALGEAQLRWLESTLASADRSGERVMVFCHAPVLAAASTPQHLLWDHEAALRILESHRSAAAWISGHDHHGGYALSRGIHHVTLEGMVESGGQDSFGFVEVYPDRLVIRGSGTLTSRTLPLHP
jgi:hypothetical protein